MACGASHQQLGQIGNRLVLIVVVSAAAVPLVAATLGYLASIGPAAVRDRANAQLVLVDWLLTRYQEYGTWEEVGQRLPQDNGLTMSAWWGRFAIVDIAGQVVVAGAGYYPGDRLSPTELAATSPLFVDGLQVGRLLIAEIPSQPVGAVIWRRWLEVSLAVIMSSGLVTFWVRRRLVAYLFEPVLQPPAGA